MSTELLDRPALPVCDTANRSFAGRSTPWLWLVLAVLLACTMWLYVHRVLIAHQVAAAAHTHEPRGNLSDLYPRWLGTQALFIDGRDPYSASVTRDVQVGYWGRALDSHNPNDPKDEGRFAYPIYVVFLLAPTMWLSFGAAQIIVSAVLAVLTAISVPLWLRALRIPARRFTTVVIVVLTLGSWPVIQALHLQQLTLLVAALLAGSAAALASGRLQLAGALLAVATIKPQLVVPIAGWLMVWVVGNWAQRRRLVWGFAATLGILVLAGEVVLPGWIGEWLGSLNAYVKYNDSEPLLRTLFGPVVGSVLRYGLAAAGVLLCWRNRRLQVGTPGFNAVLATIMTVNLLITPTWHPYDQVVLLPAVFWLGYAALGRAQFAKWPSARVALATAAVALAWSSVTALVLATLSFVSPAVADRFYVIPLIAVFALPPAIMAALWFAAYDVLRGAAPSPAT